MDKNLQREFQKIDHVLKYCQKYLEHMAKMNAVLHAAPEVFYSPLHAKITSVRAGIKILLSTGTKIVVVPQETPLNEPKNP